MKAVVLMMNLMSPGHQAAREEQKELPETNLKLQLISSIASMAGPHLEAELYVRSRVKLFAYVDVFDRCLDFIKNLSFAFLTASES